MHGLPKAPVIRSGLFSSDEEAERINDSLRVIGRELFASACRLHWTHWKIARVASDDCRLSKGLA